MLSLDMRREEGEGIEGIEGNDEYIIGEVPQSTHLRSDGTHEMKPRG